MPKQATAKIKPEESYSDKIARAINTVLDQINRHAIDSSDVLNLAQAYKLLAEGFNEIG